MKAARVLDRIGISERFIGKERADLAERLIKEYASLVAIETLQEVISKFDDQYSGSDEELSLLQKLTILSTEIKTP